MRFPLVALFALTLGFAVGARAEKICIDPGHGGADPGGVGCGLEEEDIVPTRRCACATCSSPTASRW
jgi:hypothetical protein